MFAFLWLWFSSVGGLLCSRRNLLIENLALRQQLVVFKRQRRRPRLAITDQLFWVFLCRFWSSWKKTLIVVSPDTVLRWHRTGFRLYWRILSRVRNPIGRRPVTQRNPRADFQNGS